MRNKTLILIVLILLIIISIFEIVRGDYLNKEMVGTWESGGNDVGRIEIIFNKDGNFTLHEEWSNIDFEKLGSKNYIPKKPTIRNFNGKWHVVQRIYETRLKLSFDQDLNLNSDIEKYNTDGWKFTSKNEAEIVLNKINSKYEFRYSGILISKVNN